MQVGSHLQAYERSRWNSKNSSYELFLSFHVFKQVIVKWKAIMVASWKPVLQWPLHFICLNGMHLSYL